MAPRLLSADAGPASLRLVLGLLLLIAGTVGARAENAAVSSPALELPESGTAFPLTVPAGQRYLEDAAGRPFFIHGDTAWSLIAELTREDAEFYLRDRRKRGFNTILVNLLEHSFATNAPANAYSDRPFLVEGNFVTPNEPYFAHADWVLRRAHELGFLVLLTPSYTGYGGGPEGWYQEMVASGADKLRAYGRFLGERYRELDNIVWVHAGDFDPPEKDLVRAIADGIREADPQALHTAHGGPGTAALEYWEGEPWLAINNVYTYEPVHHAAFAQYEREEALPFFLMESAYENEHGAGEDRLRMQAYQAVLSGVAGHLFGNNPIWHFSGPGIYPVEMGWKEALGSPGARSMSTLLKLVSSINWWQLEPDLDSNLLIDGLGSYEARAVAARARDGSFALVYVPTGRDVTLDLSQLSGSRIAARWFDPSNGRYFEVEGSPFRPGVQTLTQTLPNHAGFSDWVLELTSEAGSPRS